MAMPRTDGDEVFEGALGQTRAERIHYSCPCGVLFGAEIHVAVNGTRDPALAGRLCAGSLNRVQCPACGAVASVVRSVLYHDEAGRRVFLVLPESMRHRELEERAEILLALARDPQAVLPRYARDFGVVFGSAGLGRALAGHEAPGPGADGAGKVTEVTAVTAAIPVASLEEPDTGPFPKTEERDGGRGEAVALLAETGQVALPPLPGGGEVDEPELERWILSRAPTLVVADALGVRLCVTLSPARLAVFSTAQLAARIQLHWTPAGPVTVLCVECVSCPDEELLACPLDVAREEDRKVLAALAADFRFALVLHDARYVPAAHREVVAPLAENARFVMTAAGEHLAALPPSQRSFEAALAAWRAPDFDRVGRREHNLEEDTFAALPTPGTTRLALGIVALWSAKENEDYLLYVRSFPVTWWRRIRARVAAAAVEFGLVLRGALAEVAIANGHATDRKDLVARLVRAFAEVAEGKKSNDLDIEMVRENWRALVAEGESLGVPVDGRARDGALSGAAADKAMAADVRGALPSTAAMFGGPGGPSLGTVIAQAARTKGARSQTVQSPPVSGGERGRSVSPSPFGVPERSRTGTGPVPVVDLRYRTIDELMAVLADKDLRRDAAIELCLRSDPSVVDPVFTALAGMTRGEAVRVFPVIVRFGDKAVPRLVTGLRSRKAFLRQGCALALGVFESAEGVEALSDLLVVEPTEVWREVARALGEIGTAAVVPLLSRLNEVGAGEAAGLGSDFDEPPCGRLDREERISWALAHVAARGGAAEIERIAEGTDVVEAAAARRALARSAEAADNDAEVKRLDTPQEQTVNRAFSRRFFAALAGRTTEVAPRSRPGGRERRGDPIPLEESELIDEDSEFLDDEDIIPG